MIVYFSCHNYHAKLNINSIACSYSDVPPPSQGLSSRIEEPPAYCVNYLKNIHDMFRFYYHTPSVVYKVGGPVDMVSMIMDSCV